MKPGGMSRAQLEAEVQDIMTLMDPSYFKEDSDAAEAMRRLLFAGAVLIATASETHDETARPHGRVVGKSEKSHPRNFRVVRRR